MPERSRTDKPEKDPLAVELGRRGGLKGGKARAAKTTAEERSGSARNAARARWARERGGEDIEGEKHGNDRRTRWGEVVMTRTRTSVLTASFFLLAGTLALALVLLTGKSSGSNHAFVSKAGGEAGDTPGEVANHEGPTSYEAYMSAAR